MKKYITVFVTIFFVMFCGLLFADNLVNSVSLSSTIKNDSIYFYRMFIVLSLCYIPLIAVIIHSLYKKSFSDFKCVFVLINLFLVLYFEGSIYRNKPYLGIIFIQIYFIFLLCALFKKGNRSILRIFIVVFLSFFVQVTFTIPNIFYRHKAQPLQHACYSNIRVIQGAIEMYNMDYKQMISNLDEEAWKNLVSNNYLKKGIKCPEGGINNKYKGEDLDRDGEVYCGVKGIGHKVIDYWGNWIPSKDNLHGSLSGK